MSNKKSYADEWFKKHGYEKDTEDQNLVIYEKEDRLAFVKRVVIASASSPPYFEYSIESYMSTGGGFQYSVPASASEIIHAQMKAKEMWQKFITPSVMNELSHIPQKYPNT